MSFCVTFSVNVLCSETTEHFYDCRRCIAQFLLSLENHPISYGEL